MAIKLVEEMGGKVTTTFTSKETIHSLLNPSKYSKIPELVLPNTLKEIGKYSEKRGYLHPIVKDLNSNEILGKVLQKVGIQLK
jgi:hypothetical protein